MSTTHNYEEARHLVDSFPKLQLGKTSPNSTWADLQYQIYFRQAVEAGLADSQENRVVSLEEARKQFRQNQMT